MSEEDFDESQSSEDPFESNSEDDWQPGTQDSSESEFEDDVLTGSSPSPDKRSKASSAKKKSTETKNAKKPTSSGKVMSGSIRELLNKAKAGRRERLDLSQTESTRQKSNGRTATKVDGGESDDSKSSGDEYLVDPSNLDLGSSFFKPVSPAPARIPTPNFECNVGVGQLSDSEEDVTENDVSHEQQLHHDVIKNMKSFAQNVDEAKANLRRYEAKGPRAAEETGVDVSSLLALGESSVKEAGGTERGPSAKQQGKKKKRSRRQSADESGDSDWEEVEDYEQQAEVGDASKAPEDVQVTLDLPDRRRERLQNELEVALKRQMNKEKREQQVLIHQGGFTDWLERGNYFNGTLNNTTLFQIALKLLPSTRAYPKDKADLKYFEELTKWYFGAIQLPPGAEMHPPLAADLDLHNSLRKQIEAKTATSKRDFILIFIILLRAMGIQCRMVINLVVPPIRPPQSELCRITTKPKEEASSSAAKKRKAKVTDNDDSVEHSSTTERKRKTPAKKPDLESPSTSSRKNERQSSKDRKKSSTRDKPEKEKSRREESVKKKSSRGEDSKGSSSSKSKTESKSSVSPRKTRSKAPAIKTLVVPQVDGMDDVSSPIGKRTRSRSKTPVDPSLAKKLIISKNAADSPIKSKRSSTNVQRPTGNTLQVPKVKEDPHSSTLFAVDPTEKKTVITPKPSKRSKVETEEEEPVKKPSRSRESTSKIDRRVLSTDEDEKPVDLKTSANKIDFWPEVWSEVEERWFCVDLFKRKVGSCETVVRSATVPIAYALAWNNDSTIKDVSLRYCPQWHSVNRKMRTDQAFVDEKLKPHMGRNTAQDKQEDAVLKQSLLDRPMPTAVSDFKNHPLYALKRHLLKFEAIYPPDPLTLGFVRGEPVYARECVHVLHSRELWVKQARVVKLGETPYKIVTARPKWERATNTVIKDQPLELFGLWQTMEYEPPVAENGIVPKNAYGNVELFKECMLPINTVHLPYTGLNKVCKRLKIDYAPAVVGFDFHSGYSHPVYEGYVVCKEFAELVTDAWIKETEEAAQREEEKFKARVYNNWKRLIKGLFIKKRLERRYNFVDSEPVESAQD